VASEAPPLDRAALATAYLPFAPWREFARSHRNMHRNRFTLKAFVLL